MFKQTPSAETNEKKHEQFSGTVLICEDDHSFRELTVAFLEGRGLTIYQSADPIAALALCKEIDGQFDLLITDVIMPYMNGCELSKKLAEMYEFTTIFMSGYSANIIADNGISSSDVLFIQKPFSRSQLIESVNKALNQSN